MVKRGANKGGCSLVPDDTLLHRACKQLLGVSQPLRLEMRDRLVRCQPALHDAFVRIAVTLPVVATGVLSQYVDHAAITCRRFSSRSPRWYAALTLSFSVWARQRSARCRKLVRSSHQSRNADRKPCTVKPLLVMSSS